MFIADLAQEIILLDSTNPSGSSIPAIAYFIRSSVGTINSLLCEDFVIDQNSLEIKHRCGHNISKDATAVIRQMYKVYDAKLQMSNTMNALASNDLLSVKDEFGGNSYSRTNRNEMSKTWASLMKQETDALQNLVGAYKISKSNPVQVVGDDFIPAYYGEKLISLRGV